MHLQYITHALIARGYADENREWHDEQEFYFWELHYENKHNDILDICSLVQGF